MLSSSGVPVPAAPLLSSSSGTPVPAAPLLSQGGSDVFAAIVPPLRSSIGFLKKRVAE